MPVRKEAIHSKITTVSGIWDRDMCVCVDRVAC